MGIHGHVFQGMINREAVRKDGGHELTVSAVILTNSVRIFIYGTPRGYEIRPKIDKRHFLCYLVEVKYPKWPIFVEADFDDWILEGIGLKTAYSTVLYWIEDILYS